MDDEWRASARNISRSIASSAHVISINPGDDIDPKIALETGYMVLLNKPIILVVRDGDERVNPGLARIAHHTIRLTAPLASDEGQMQLTAGLQEAGLNVGRQN